MKKNLKKQRIFGSILLVLAIIAFIYICNISSIPDSIILFQGEELNLKTILGLNLEAVDDGNEIVGIQQKTIAVQTATNLQTERTHTGKKDFKLSLFGAKIKDVTINVIPTTSVVPLGNLAGLKLYTDGVLVVGMSEIEGKDKLQHKPYENTGIEEGDRIVQVNEKAITCTAELLENVNKSNGNQIKLTYIREGETQQTSIKPIQTGEDEYKLGLWVRDAAAGVGTLSFYEPASGMFASLGHGILDIDTNELLPIASGEFVTTNIVSVTKGQKGNPGKIQGSIENQKELGEIYKNTEFGVYGKLNNKNLLNININNAIEVGLRDEIKIGSAKIRCTLENNITKEYDIEIQKIDRNNNINNKSMIVKVTDKELLEKTGGIIQGMSGSPIIQNGKLVGALTHVLVNDPTSGYAVFADRMVKEMHEVK